MNKLVYGVGVYENGFYVNKVDKVITKEYTLWFNMLCRCYSESYQNRQPTYIGCTASENFKNFQYFAEWCNKQKGYTEKGYHLDKDLLLKGNRVYSEEICVFIPRAINSFLSLCGARRGDLPVGVTLARRNQKFLACVNDSGKLRRLGEFDSVEKAFMEYKKAKEEIAKKLACKYKNYVDERVIEALLNYEVSILD